VADIDDIELNGVQDGGMAMAADREAVQPNTPFARQ
jgi:hypothetical protein